MIHFEKLDLYCYDHGYTYHDMDLHLGLEGGAWTRDVVNGRRKITPLMAVRLEDLTSITAREWLVAQVDYQLSQLCEKA